MRVLKITLLVLLCSLTAKVNGQATTPTNGVSGIHGGSILMGGTMGFTSSTSTTKVNGVEAQTGSQFQFSLAPKMGYFFLRNFCAGLTISFSTASRSTVVADSTNSESESQLLAGPFFRYYWFPGKRVGIFGELEVGLGASGTNSESGKYSGGQFSLGIGPGLTFFANDMVAIEALVKYNMLTQKYSSTVNNQPLDVSATINSINFGVGFQFYFNRVIGGGM